jgi:uncharacterized protein YjbI with pentapeptide repeats
VLAALIALTGVMFAQSLNAYTAWISQRRELASARDDALQGFLQDMKELLVAEQPDQEMADAHKRAVVRAKVRMALLRLDGNGKGTLLRFLHETGSIKKATTDNGNLPPKELHGVDLSYANLRFADLRDSDLRGVNLRSADLREADLTDTDLRKADLNKADLSSETDNRTILAPVVAKLVTTIEDVASLSDTNLSGANLSGANLSYAVLRRADLRRADLSEADLSGADLALADLSGAKGITEEMLEQAESLRGAIMPDATIHPGRYAARMFEPAVSFEVGEGWEFWGPETFDELFIQTGPNGGQLLLFTNPRHVFDPSNPSEAKELPEPEQAEEWISWFQRHPNLDTSKPVPVNVGGASGMRIDVTITSTPQNYPVEVCGEQPCVPLYPTSEFAISSYEGSKDRFVIVDVGGETVLIDVFAPAHRFDEFLPKAQEVLDSVEWEGG